MSSFPACTIYFLYCCFFEVYAVPVRICCSFEHIMMTHQAAELHQPANVVAVCHDFCKGHENAALLLS